MRFSRLRLTGFKSFVDPTELVISNGLTGVVGPNGCGKSNLLEALRWVMGENRPTAMRGGGMEDVIFAGAASRAARNYAEVSLLIDNSERLAPVAFNQDDKLEVIRRITRDVGSAYKTNGKDTRARDVQMLFADASTGAHSPSLVRQGQISELINAKPKARRRVLEEAAGISGLYQRRHEAELKLRAAETNLTRVDDVVEQLDGQLKTLERQAKQAKRYREIGEELRKAEGLLLYRRWKEADQAQHQAKTELKEATQAAAQAQGLANKANQARTKAEDLLPPLRDELAIASAALQRLLVSRDGLDDQERRAKEQLETLQARIEQLGKDIEREIALNADAAETIERLEWEAREIDKASQGHDEALASANEAARSAAQVMQDAESELDKLTEDAARLAARHQSAHRLLDEANAVLARREASAAEIAENVKTATEASIQAQAAVSEADQKDRMAQEARNQSETALSAAETARAEAQTAEGEARAVLSEAEATANALGAEVTALERVIARDKTDDDQLIDKLRVEKGFEAALGAALADDLKAPIVSQEGISGWRALPDYDQAAALPDGATPLSEKVQAPDLLTRRLSQIGVVAHADGARLQAQLKPGQRLVTQDGDLWRWDGFAQGAEDASSASALRLQQMNRLSELQETRAAASETMMAAQAKFNAIHADLQAAQANEQDARKNRKAADDAATEATRALSKAKAEAEMRLGQVETLTLAKDRVAAELRDAQTASKEAQKAVTELGDVDAARGEVETKKISVEAARVTMLTKRSLFDELRREGEQRKKRAQEITQEVSGWKHRQRSAETHIAELKQRKSDSQEELTLATAAPEDIAAQRAALATQVEKSEKRMVDADNAVSEAEKALRQADADAREGERKASDCREARARADAVAEAAKAQIEVAAERIMEEMDCSPDALLEQLDTDPEHMPPSDKIEENVQRLRRQRDAMGAVNLRAEEDAIEVTNERDGLTKEKLDLEEAIRELRKGIAGLNKEGRERLLAAFDEVNANFSNLFKKLFGGGEANLVLVESDDPLEAGLEIMCQPPGKKLATLSLLSGGEQTLTALALIFAVFLASPAPICVLDEVDAPLDDANVTRFCNMLDEMVSQTDTRFLIITHHAVTMARMDRLFGVTMAEQGVSQLVSVDLQAAEEMVDA